MHPDEDRHAAEIKAQFTAQAEAFARSPTLHSDAALELMFEAGAPASGDTMLDVACGPGAVVAAYAPHVQWATGLDATEAMLAQARKLAAERGLANVEWRLGDVYALPFADGALDIVTCRFAMHHLQHPARAFAEMVRVCRAGGRIVVCDGLASDDPAKARALNEFERLRDPSTVGFRTGAFLRALFAGAGMNDVRASYYKHPGALSTLLKNSFPAGGDYERLCALVQQSVDGDLLGLNARREGDDVLLETPVVVLSATKP